MGCRVFGALGKDRAIREVAVATRVVEVQVTVRQGGDLIGPHTQALQLSANGPGHGMVVRLGFFIGLGKPRVEQEEAAAMADQVGADADGLAGERIARAVRHGEVAEIQTGDGTNCDHVGMVRIAGAPYRFSTRIQSIWMSSLPEVPDGQPDG